MNTETILPSENENPKDIQDRITALSGPARLLLKHLVMNRATDTLVVEKSIDVLATELCKDVRSIHTAMKKLKTAGLVTRRSISGMFTPCVTVINSFHVVNCITNPHDFMQVKKTVQTKKVLQPKPFSFLKDPNRLANIQVEMQQALHSADAYWDFICTAFQSIGFNAPLTTEVQSRNLTTGRRSGTHKFRSRNVRLSNVVLEMANVAHYAQSQLLEASFRVNCSKHPLILIDDVDKSTFANLPAASAILETSPGNYQVTLIAPRPLSSKEFLLVEDALLGILGCGDRGAKGIHQLRRFPGSLNNKAELASAFVTRVEHVPTHLTLTTNELNDLIEAGKKIRGFFEWDDEVAAAQVVSTDAKVSIGIASAMPSEGTNGQAATNDKSASGRDFGKAIELIRKGLDDTSIIQEIMFSAGKRMKYGRPPGHPSHLVYAQGTVSRARSRFKSNAPRMNLTWLKKNLPTVSTSQTTGHAMQERPREAQTHE